MSLVQSRLLRIAEVSLWCFALSCIAWYGTVQLSARVAQQNAETFRPSTVQELPVSNAVSTLPVDSSKVIGRLEIPGLSLRVAILSDYQAKSLLQGVGHIQGTANPGGLGNLVLAGHRDTYFKPLKKIARGMDVRIVVKEGVYHYIVDRTELVRPEQVGIMSIGDVPELTLITCYPFDYIGAAPERFIVHAHLLSAMPTPQ